MSFHRNLTGADLHAPSNELVENNSGSTIASFKCVKFNGFGTNFPQVVIADQPSDNIAGIMQVDLATGAVGYISSLGFMYGLNTLPYAINSLLYSDVMGNLSPVPYGFPIAQVIKSDATTGVIYVDSTIGINQQVLAGAWFTTGNTALNPDPLVGNFLGNADHAALRIRTDNIHRMTVSEDGRFGFGQEATAPLGFFHLKAHTGYPGSGHQKDTFALTTTNDQPSVAYAVTVPATSTVMVTFKVVGRQQDGTAHCSFKRTASGYLEGIQAVIDGLQSDYTAGGPGFNVSVTVNMNAIVFNVQNLSGAQTNWGGSIELEVIS